MTTKDALEKQFDLPTELKKIEKQYTLGLDEVMTEFYHTALLTLVKRVGEEAKEKIEELWKEKYDKLKSHKDYPHTDKYSVDYLNGIVRGLVLASAELAQIDEMLQTLEKKDL